VPLNSPRISPIKKEIHDAGIAEDVSLTP